MNHQFIWTLACKSINANVYKTQETLHIANVTFAIKSKTADTYYVQYVQVLICLNYCLKTNNQSEKKKPKLNPFNILDAHCFLEK